MANGQPRPAFYVAVLLVVLGLVGLALYRYGAIGPGGQGGQFSSDELKQMQKGADIPASKSVTTPRPFYCVSRRWTSDHSHRAEYFIAAVHDHVGRNIDDYKQSRVADPGMPFQKSCHIARSNAH